jgi:hypothetical protein
MSDGEKLPGHCVATPGLPEPLQPQVLAPRAAGAAGVACAVIAALFVVFGDRIGTSGSVPHSTHPGDGAGRPEVVALAPDRAPGAFTILPSSFQNAPGSVLAQINMPEAEKHRLAEKLAQGSVRLAAVTLWDSVEEDGDAVEISAAGFRQTIVLMHKPKTFFLPVQVGGSVSIKAVRDGGGGVTLGVKTILGPVPLPPLAVGQVVEIPVL